MLRPSYSIDIESETIEPSSADDLISVKISLDLAVPANSCEAVFRPAKWTSKLKRDSPVTVQLGYEDNLKTVFSGTVDSYERNLHEVRTFSLSQVLRLLDSRVNSIYTSQTAGGIVNDLASKASVDVEDAEDGLDFPVYYVDDSKNSYDHIQELADRCGFDVYMNEEGKLVFHDYNPQDKHPFEYGKDIVSIEADFREPVIESVKAYGESPSSKKGSDTSHWLTKDEVSGEEGSGSQLELVDSAIRDKDTAEKVAKATLKKLSFAKFFSVIVVGSPQVRLGDAVIVKSMPEDVLNGEFKVMSIEHRLSKSEGFTTRIDCGGLK